MRNNVQRSRTVGLRQKTVVTKSEQLQVIHIQPRTAEFAAGARQCELNSPSGADFALF